MTENQLRLERKRCHSPSPLHLAACIYGGAIHRNKKKYTRKTKYKEKYEW